MKTLLCYFISKHRLYSFIFIDLIYDQIHFLKHSSFQSNTKKRKLHLCCHTKNKTKYVQLSRSYEMTNSNSNYWLKVRILRHDYTARLCITSVFSHLITYDVKVWRCHVMFSYNILSLVQHWSDKKQTSNYSSNYCLTVRTGLLGCMLLC